jgi:hypothetical protein
LTLIR